MRRHRLSTMKFLKQFITTVCALCLLTVGAMAFQPQKDGQKPPPPPKEKQEVPKPEKPPPPPPRNNDGNKGNDGKKGKP
jgi:hypothetical protein